MREVRVRKKFRNFLQPWWRLYRKNLSIWENLEQEIQIVHAFYFGSSALSWHCLRNDRYSKTSSSALYIHLPTTVLQDSPTHSALCGQCWDAIRTKHWQVQSLWRSTLYSHIPALSHHLIGRIRFDQCFFFAEDRLDWKLCFMMVFHDGEVTVKLFAQLVQYYLHAFFYKRQQLWVEPSWCLEFGKF